MTFSFPDQLRGTTLHRLVHYAMINLQRKREFSFGSPVGSIDLVLPSKLWDVDGEYYEEALVRELSERLSADTVFYDIGGYVGYISTAAINVGVSPGNIHTFEGVPFRYYVCRDNCAPRGVHVTNSYVGASTTGRTLAIDDYVRDNDSPDVVKIDVEGHEHHVLRGMTRTLTQDRPTLYVEVHPELLADNGTSESAVGELLAEHDYDLAYMRHRDGKPHWRDTPEYDDSTNSPTYLLRATP